MQRGEPTCPQDLFASYRALTKLSGKDTAHPADLWDSPWAMPTLTAPEGIEATPPCAQLRTLFDQHVLALLPAGAPLSMEAAFALLQAPLQQQLLGLWGQLEAQVQVCKAMNQRNCQLIMEQAEVMRAVIVGNAQPEIYAPL